MLIRPSSVSKQTICLFAIVSMAVAFLFNVELFPNPADFGQSRRGYGKVAESLEFGGWEERHVSAQIKIGRKSMFQPKSKFNIASALNSRFLLSVYVTVCWGLLKAFEFSSEPHIHSIFSLNRGSITLSGLQKIYFH